MIIVIIVHVWHGMDKAEEKDAGPNKCIICNSWLSLIHCFKSIVTAKRRLLTIQKDIKRPLSSTRLVYFRAVEHESQIGCTYDAQLGIHR